MNIRRIMGLAALSTAVVFGGAPGASAQETEGYSARSSGTTFELSVVGQGGKGGHAEATIDATGRAAADAAAFDILGFPFGASSADTAEDQPGAAEPSCEVGFDQIPFFQFALGCSSATATDAGGAPRAAATTTIGEGGGSYKPFLDTPVSQFVGPLQQGADAFLSAFEAITGPIDEQGFNLQGSLEELFGSLFEGADLLRVTAGDTAVETKVTDGTISSTCSNEGIRIDVLKGEANGPVLSVIVGQASTEVVGPVDGSAPPTTTADPSPVRVESPLIPGGAFLVPGFQRVEVPLGDPFGTIVLSGGGSKTGVDEAGASFALVQAANLELFTGFQGGIKLTAAECESVLSPTGATSAAAAQATVSAASQPPSGMPRSLPRTGGTGAWPMVPLLGVAALARALVRRADSRTGVPSSGA